MRRRRQHDDGRRSGRHDTRCQPRRARRCTGAPDEWRHGRRHARDHHGIRLHGGLVGQVRRDGCVVVRGRLVEHDNGPVRSAGELDRRRHGHRSRVHVGAELGGSVHLLGFHAELHGGHDRPIGSSGRWYGAARSELASHRRRPNTARWNRLFEIIGLRRAVCRDWFLGGQLLRDADVERAADTRADEHLWILVPRRHAHRNVQHSLFWICLHLRRRQLDVRLRGHLRRQRIAHQPARRPSRGGRDGQGCVRPKRRLRSMGELPLDGWVGRRPRNRRPRRQ